MRSAAGKFLIAFLLTLMAGACVLELSGRWDQSIQDANDEAGFVGIVLCVGAGLSIAAAMLDRLSPIGRTRQVACIARTVRRSGATPLMCRTVLDSAGPPAPLRI